MECRVRCTLHLIISCDRLQCQGAQPKCEFFPLLYTAIPLSTFSSTSFSSNHSPYNHSYYSSLYIFYHPAEQHIVLTFTFYHNIPYLIILIRTMPHYTGCSEDFVNNAFNCAPTGNLYKTCRQCWVSSLICLLCLYYNWIRF